MRISLFLLSFILLFAQCNKEDDSNNCTDYAINWTPADNETADATWLVLTDESGALITSVKGEEGQDLELNVENCGTRLDATAFSFERRWFTVDGQDVEIPVYHLRTFLDVPADFQIKDVEETIAGNRSIAVQGVTSLEELIWPASNNLNFDGTAYIDPSASLLSFEIQVPERHPAFVRVRANGEAQTRYIWIDSVQQADYTLAYESLPLLQPQGPVALPNDEFWNFNIYGKNTLFETRLAYPINPSLASDEFGAALPQNQDVSQLRVEAFQPANTSDGRIYYPYYYSENRPGLPASITTIEPDFSVTRSNEQLNISVSGESLTALEVSLEEQSSTNTRLIWTIYGKPEHFTSFTWPAWPESLTNEQATQLSKNESTPLIVNALQYGTSPLYEEFINARAQENESWEKEQGLRSRARRF